MVRVNNAFNSTQQTGFNQAQSAPFQSTQSPPNQAPFPEQPASNQAQFQSNQAPSPKGLFQIPEKFLQLIPWIPLGLEMLTGQKIPPTGVLADILDGMQQIQFSLSQLHIKQQQLWTKLESLENNASNQLTSLSQQVASTNQAFRLMHQKETKSLEFNPRPQPELAQNYNETETY